MSNKNSNNKNKSSGCLTIPFILFCLFFGGKEGYNHINNNEPASSKYKAQSYTQQYQQQNYNNNDIEFTDQRSKSLHEFNMENNSNNDQYKQNNNINTLELRSGDIKRNQIPEDLNLRPEDYY